MSDSLYVSDTWLAWRELTLEDQQATARSQHLQVLLVRCISVRGCPELS